MYHCLWVYCGCLAFAWGLLQLLSSHEFHVPDEVFQKGQGSSRGFGVSSSVPKLKVMACEGAAMGPPRLATVGHSPTVMLFYVYEWGAQLLEAGGVLCKSRHHPADKANSFSATIPYVLLAHWEPSTARCFLSFQGVFSLWLSGYVF